MLLDHTRGIVLSGKNGMCQLSIDCLLAPNLPCIDSSATEAGPCKPLPTGVALNQESGEPLQ